MTAYISLTIVLGVIISIKYSIQPPKLFSYCIVLFLQVIVCFQECLRCQH